MKVGKFGQVGKIEGARLERLPAELAPSHDEVDDDTIVVVEDYHHKPPLIVVLGRNKWEALHNLVWAIVDAYDDGAFGVAEILNVGGYPDFNPYDELVGAYFPLATDENGWRYVLHLDLEHRGFDFRHVPPTSSITSPYLRAPVVPEEIFWKAIEVLAEAYFGGAQNE